MKYFRSGQSTLEIIVAIGIFASVIAAVIILVFGGQVLTTDAGESHAALAIARKNLEELGALARGNFAALESETGTEAGFAKDISVSALDANTKKVTVAVSWTSFLKLNRIVISEIFTNWKNTLLTGGDTGGGSTSGDWQNPRTLDSIDLGPGNEATDLDVLRKVVYLTAAASDPKKNDFFVLDALDGQNMTLASSIDVGAGLNAVDVASGTAYVANNSTSDQLLLLNVANFRSTTTLTSSFTLPGVSGANAIGQSIFYSGDRVYIGTKRATGPELHIIDVSSPLNPFSLGSFEIDADVNSIQVEGDYAFLATSADSGEMKILNISAPNSILSAGSFNAPGTEDGLAVYLYGGTLYLGRSSGSTIDEFYILDVSDPANIKILGSKKIGSDVTGIRIRDELAFLGTSDSNKEFQVWNISSTTAISLWSSFNFPQVATGVDYEDNLVYVSVRSNDAVRVITSSP